LLKRQNIDALAQDLQVYQRLPAEHAMFVALQYENHSIALAVVQAPRYLLVVT
jgi:hypothetical protein